MNKKRRKVGYAICVFACCVAPMGLKGGEGEGGEEKSQTLTGSRIQSVTIFDGVARVTRSVPVTIPKGDSRLTLSGLPRRMKVSSLSVRTGADDVKLQSVSCKDTSSGGIIESVPEKKIEYQKIQEDSEKLVARIAFEENRLARMKASIATIPTHLNAKETPLRFDVAAAVNLCDYFTEGLRQANGNLLAMYKERSRFHRESAILYHEQWKREGKSIPEKSVNMHVKSEEERKTVLEVSYIIGPACWQPYYEVRIDPATMRISLSMYASVSQDTDEDWADVPLKFSTANPLVVAELPVLDKHLISERFQSEDGDLEILDDAFEIRRYGLMSHGGRAASGTLSAERRVKIEHLAPVYEAAKVEYTPSTLSEYNFPQSCDTTYTLRLADGKTVRASSIRAQQWNPERVLYTDETGKEQSLQRKEVESILVQTREAIEENVPSDTTLTLSDLLNGLDYRFDAARAETVGSTNEATRVLLKTISFQGEKYYQIMPWNSTKAYLRVKMKNSSPLPILQGMMSLFLGNEYVGNGSFPYLEQDGHHEFALGIDPRVQVRRAVRRKSESIGTFSKARLTSVETDVQVRNNTDGAIRMEIYERIPVSENKAVMVRPPKFSKEGAGDIDASRKSGIYRFEKTLEKGNDFSLSGRYAIEYPLDYVVTNSETGVGFGKDIDRAEAGK